jgi:hypothetical protein
MKGKIKHPTDDAKIKRVMAMVEHELRAAGEKNGPMLSAHEGYGLILEELDELWDEVKKKKRLRDRKLMTTEAMQVSAMAARFIVDLL